MTKGFKHSEESLLKMSKAKKGKKMSEETKIKMSKNSACFWKGKKFSDEHLKNLSDSHIGYKVSEETKKKIRLGCKGEKSYAWIKDRTKLKKSENKQNDVQHKEWRKEVRKRDCNKCRLLSSECNGRIETHHIFNWIDYSELRYIINNGITLCAFHHPRGREKEKRMIPILQELLSVSEE